MSFCDSCCLLCWCLFLSVGSVFGCMYSQKIAEHTFTTLRALFLSTGRLCMCPRENAPEPLPRYPSQHARLPSSFDLSFFLGRACLNAAPPPGSGNDTDVHHLFFSRLWTVGRTLDEILKTRRRHLRLEPGEEGRPLELARVDASGGLPTGRCSSISISSSDY